MGVLQSLHRWIWPQRGERLKAAVVYGLVGVLVTAALLLTGIRVLLAAAPAMTGVVERVVGEQLGVELRIGGLDARLQGLRPGLVLRDVEVLGTADGPKDPLALDELTLVIAPWDALRDRALRLHGLEAAGLDMTLRREAAAQWQVSGLLPLPVAAPVDRLLDQLQALPVDRLLIRDSRLVLRDVARESELELEPVALRWHQMDEGDWRFALDARAGDQRLRGRLELAVGEAPSARAVIDFSDIEAAQWLTFAGLEVAALRPAPDARLAGRIWLALDNEGPTQAVAQVNGRRLGLLDGGLETLEATGHWARTPAGWEAALRPQRLLDQQGQAQDVGVVGVGRADAAGAPLRLTARNVSLAPLMSGWAARSGVPAMASGSIPRLDLVWHNRAQWQAQATLAEAGVRVTDARLRNPVAIESLTGMLNAWQDGPAGWRLHADDWRGEWAGAPLQISGTAQQDSDDGTVVDIEGHVGSLPTSTVMNHLPVGLMHEKLTAWLDQAVQGGELTGASLRLAGPLTAFPFDDDEGLFDLQAQLADVDFAFNPDWPAFSGLEGTLRFRNRGLSIEADRGELNGISLVQAEARLPDLWKPRLRIEGALNGPVARMADVVVASPLLGDGALPGEPAWSGDADLNLTFFFPFEKRPPEMDGELSFDEVAVTVDTPALRVTDLAGDIAFDDDGVRWDGLRGRYQGQDVISQARTDGEGEAARIRVDARTELALADWPGLSGVAERVKGDARWRLRWEQPGFPALRAEREPETRLLVRSDLVGIETALPFGLGKSLDEAVAGRFEWRRSGDAEHRFAVSYGERLRARGAHDPNGEQRWGLAVGPSEPVLPEASGTAITGALPVITLADLRALATDSAGSGDSLTLGLPPVRQLALEVEGLEISRWRVEPFTVTGAPRGAGWSLGLEGGGQGVVEWRTDAEKGLDVDLETLTLALRASDPGAQQPMVTPVPREPADRDRQPMPFDVDVDALSAGGESLGALAFSRGVTDAGGDRAELTLEGAVVDLDAVVARNDANVGEARLEFSVLADDAGRFFTGLGLPAVMRNGQGDIRGELTWLGPLLSPVLPTLAGDLAVDLHNGSLPAVEPGAGRALGLFSLSVLPRRLGLDFSDVVGEGLRFDRLQGSWQARAGRLQTDDLSVAGPSLNLSLAGTTDVVKQRYDQTVTVRPQVTSALSFLGGLAGGPAAAVALFLTRGMIEPEVDQLTEIQYRIAGPWDDPQLELLSPRGLSNRGQDND